MPESAYPMIFALEGLLVLGAIGTGVILFLTNRHHRNHRDVTTRVD
jgi:hypothetical protein